MKSNARWIRRLAPEEKQIRLAALRARQTTQINHEMRQRTAVSRRISWLIWVVCLARSAARRICFSSGVRRRVHRAWLFMAGSLVGAVVDEHRLAEPPCERVADGLRRPW